MTLLRYALSALAAIGVAYAQGACSGDLQIRSSGDTSRLQPCSTYNGNIIISGDVQGTLELPTVREIDGDLSVTNASQLTGLTASSLETIRGRFVLNEVQILSSLNMARLTEVETIQWNALPNLQQLGFTTQVKRAATVDIQNTQLGSLDGINLEVVDRFYIANNRYLTNMDLQLGNVSTSLTLEANSVDLRVTFPNLIWAFNMTFRNCSSISVPSLRSLNGSMGLYGNSIRAFEGPNLTSVNGSLSFVSNVELTNISLPRLQQVGGGFQVANNTRLGRIDGFNALQTVGGALDFNGNFTDVQLPAIRDVRGAFNLQSSGDISAPCQRFQGMSGSTNAIKGRFVCSGRVDRPGGAGTTPTSGNGPNPTGAANSIGVSPVTMGWTALFAAFLGLI